MPRYSYQGVDANGRQQRGLVEAEDIAVAAQTLRGRGLAVTGLSPAPEASAEGDGFSLPLTGISNADLSLFLRQLASLLGSGISLVHALRVLEEQTPGRRLRRLIAALRRHLEAGGSFAEGLALYPRHFPLQIPAVVRAGEMSGTLDQVLAGLADDMEEATAFKAQVVAGFIYPAIVILATLGAFFFLAGFVIPRIVPFLSAGRGRLPWNTQLMVTISEAVVRDGRSWALATVMIVIALGLAYATGPGRALLDRVKLLLPVIGPVWKLAALVAFTKHLSTLLASGITMVESLGVVRETVGNRAMHDAVEHMRRRVTDGEPLSESMLPYRHLFPPMVVGAVRIGEEGGQLADGLHRSAAIHMQMLRSRIRRLIASIEPVVTIILGLIVGFVAWGLVAGMLSMY